MHIAYIGLGANLESAAGLPEATLAASVERLAVLGYVTRRSSLYSTEPVGYTDQPRFVNAVIELQTDLAPGELLEGLLQIEREFGRDRSAGIQNGPRTLDLDLLLYGHIVLHEAELDLPHPRLAERAFVLVPLNEIAPEARDARSGATVKELLERLRSGSPDAPDAVVPIKSDVWRAGPDGGGLNGMRADARDADG
jgi:2-amino-4-hydroxy-6-hydroxymethyldihydropteridine diphosphokinase